MNAKELGSGCAFPSNDMRLQNLVGVAASRSLPNDEREAAYIKASSAAAAGLTKRELFAAMAMQGLLAAPITDYENADPEVMQSYKGLPIGQFFADQAVRFADALLAELAKGTV